MRCVILIRKIANESNLHYYSVFKYNNYEEINYYIGLDAYNKKLLFFENQRFEQPAVCIYDIVLKEFEVRDDKVHSLIDLRVVIRGARTILADEFPDNISWEG